MMSVPQHIRFEPQDTLQPAQLLASTLGESIKNALIARGVAPERIMAVPPQRSNHLRTYHAALGLPGFLATHYPDLRRVELLSQGFHARRSWESYRLALRGTGIEVGIRRVQAASTLRGSEHLWWQTKEGRRSFIRQLHKYVGWCWWRCWPGTRATTGVAHV